MLGFLAALAFALAFIFRAFGGPHAAFLSPLALIALGLCFLALYVAGVGTWQPWRRG